MPSSAFLIAPCMMALLASAFAVADTRCLRETYRAVVEERLKYGNIQVHDRRIGPRKPGDIEIPLSDVVAGEDPVVIGFSAGAHAYLSIGGRRFDALPVKPSRFGTRDLNHNGYLFVLDLPADRKAALLKGLESGKLTRMAEYSCIHGVCRVLEQGAGIAVSEPLKGSAYSSPKLFDSFVNHGLVDTKTGEPVKTTVYRLSDSNLGQIHREYQDLQIGIPGGMALRVALPLGGYGIVKLIIYVSDRIFGSESGGETPLPAPSPVGPDL